MPEREMRARSASSVIRNEPPAMASWARTSKSARARPVLLSRSVSSWRKSVAWARSSASHACKPRPPGTSLATIRPKRVAASASESTCICNHLRLRYLQSQVYQVPGRRLRMIKEVEVDPDGSLTLRWGTRADDVRVKRTMAALEANGMTVLRASDAAAAKRIVLDLIPDASPVHQGASQTLDVLGITYEIEKSGRYSALRPRIWSMDRETEANEIRRLGAAPDVMLGSVHAVTETGSLLAASMSGSQLGPYVSGAGRVILVVGTQKIVRDLEEGLLRINEYAYRLEDAPAQAAYGVRSAVNKGLVVNREITPRRITVGLVDEGLGF